MPKARTWPSKSLAESALPTWLRNKGHISSENLYVLNKNTIGAAVRLRRSNSGLSLRSLAKWMSISHTHLSNLEVGKKPWSESRLQDATDILDMHERSKS